MNLSRLIFFAASFCATLAFAASPGEQKTIEGWVLDSACAYTKGLSKPVSRDCALACARKGSPLVILEDDGTLVLPVSEIMPAESQNAKLLPYAGERVSVTGKVYSKNGSQAIVIQSIAKANK